MSKTLLKPATRSWYCLMKTMRPGVGSLRSWKKAARKVPAVELWEALASAQEAADEAGCGVPTGCRGL